MNTLRSEYEAQLALLVGARALKRAPHKARRRMTRLQCFMALMRLWFYRHTHH
jgi:hypothetical protein